MSDLLESIVELNEMISQGKILEAFDKYYHEDVVIQENENPAVFGKFTNRMREQDFLESIIEFRKAEPLQVTSNKNTTMVEWHFDYSHKEWGERNYNQVAVQEWEDGQIVKEKFYYPNEDKEKRSYF